ncbi:hypothetical protein SK128_020720, partial [Halocaridina rubra]
MASGTRCPIRTDAVDIESRAYVAPQVVEAVVQDIVVVVGGNVDGDTRRVFDGEGDDGVRQVPLPGQIYTVTISVSKVLRRYRGPLRVKKRATLKLTFRSPSSSPSPSPPLWEEEPNTNIFSEECLVSATLRRHRKYIFFLSGEGEEENQTGFSSKNLVPVAPPEPASKKIRRLVRKMVCKRC